MKKKIKIWLPIYASALFECEVETEHRDIEDVCDDFLEDCKPIKGLCWHCGNNISTDMVIDEQLFSNTSEGKVMMSDLREQVEEMIIE